MACWLFVQLLVLDVMRQDRAEYETAKAEYETLAERARLAYEWLWFYNETSTSSGIGVCYSQAEVIQ
eukprot:2581392-Amphidinium_carterae.1